MLLHQGGENLAAGVVGQAVLGVDRLEVQDDVRASTEPAGVAQAEAAVAGGLPSCRCVGAGLPGDDLDAIRHHERRVEPDAELPDERGRGVGRGVAFELLHELARAGLGNGADQANQLLARHADAAVAHRERARLAVGRQLDLEQRVVVEKRVVL
jgi:hypothetical protein